MKQYFWKLIRIPARYQMDEASYSILDYLDNTIVRGLKFANDAEKIVEEHNKSIINILEETK